MPGNELADRLADAGMQLDQDDPGAPYGLDSEQCGRCCIPIRAMMDGIAKAGARRPTKISRPARLAPPFQ